MLQGGEALEMVQTGISDLGSVEVEVNQTRKILQMCQTCIGDFCFFQMEALKILEGTQVGGTGISNAGVLEIQFDHFWDLLEDCQIGVCQDAAFKGFGRNQNSDAFDILGNSENLTFIGLDGSNGGCFVSFRVRRRGENQASQCERSEDTFGIHGLVYFP